MMGRRTRAGIREEIRESKSSERRRGGSHLVSGGSE
jgi:hypothetical protein